jgi:hypothetical protein
VLMAETGQFAILVARHRREVQARRRSSCPATGATAPTSSRSRPSCRADKAHKIKGRVRGHTRPRTGCVTHPQDCPARFSTGPTTARC